MVHGEQARRITLGEQGWWSAAVVYQVYLRSFADSDGDGIGDLAGLTARLDHLLALGVDALWLNPCYRSPQHDHGYDIADYLAIDPAYGDMDDFRELVEEAHSRGIRVLMDMVANHCSVDHEWFRAALNSPAGSVERSRFLFRDGRGIDGERPPNNWESVFGGPAWTRVTEPDGRPGQWYSHAFDSSQPDFDWRCPEVADHFDTVLRHWFDHGVDGFRIDVAHGLVKTQVMADRVGDAADGHNYDMWDQPEVHEVYRRWRAIGDSYHPSRYFVGEIWVPDRASLAAYLAPDELHQAFDFELLVQPWNASRMRGAIDRALDQAATTGGTPAWTLSNHDVHRTVTRYGQRQDLGAPLPTDMIAAARREGEVDVPLGLARARAAIMLQLALPGSVYLYQGEELGLPEVFDLPAAARQDPIWLRSGGRIRGRDGCRVPLPWAASAPAFGFSAPGSAPPWLPQPSWFRSFAVDEQAADPGSTLALYRRLVGRRRELFGVSDAVHWLELGIPDCIALVRGRGCCIVNFGEAPVALTLPGLVLVERSGPAAAVDRLPANSAAWFILESWHAPRPHATSRQLAPTAESWPQSHEEQ